ncbi:SusC/RagA family TonB-linked outer membrane protein [Lunatimonas lonarensis]|uniref:SusC/RagA family TonB-linked outer membrane protein n=1 Tax=Lunatimonas lonarensis TaxID=1232681 RepID=UPI001EE29C55|nr:TonB-dependent receptor [Lunatimonas lonarensis]
MQQFFREVQRQTPFKFSYENQDVDRQLSVTLEKRQGLVIDLLRDVALQSDLTFRQVNHGIDVVKRKDSQAVSVESTEVADIRGVVRDENGEPLPGVTIVIDGTSTGTVTDIDGRYSISAPEGATLIFSFVGFVTQRRVVGASDTIDIRLVEDESSLDEVVVVGYGVQQKKDLTGSVATVEAADILNRQAVQLSDALQGRMAGVTVTRTGSAPGQASQIRVRGVTSLNVNDPLILIDGVPGLSLEDINPNDVESISVLKDAASQAIYGARAAAGVVVVTTKRGQTGKLQLNYDMDVGFSSPTMLPKFVDAQTFRILSNEMSSNDGGGVIFDPTENANYVQLNRDNPDAFPDTDWQAELFSNTPSTRQRHDLSMAVGTDRVRTRASFGYMKEDGIHPNIGFERFTFRLNNDVKITDYLDVNIDIAFRNSTSQNPAYTRGGGAIAEARVYPGWFSAIRTDGQWGEGKDGDNPLAETVEGGSTIGKESVFNGTLGFSLTPVKGLVLRGNMSPVYEFGNFETFRTPPLLPRLGGGFFPRNQTDLTIENRRIFTLTNQLFVTYEKKIAKHRMSLLAGYEDVRTDWEQVGSIARNLAVDLPSVVFGDRSQANNTQFASQNALQSVFGRVSYDYEGKYLLQSNFRVDGSSRFAPANRWGFFPSVSAGWVVSNERFSLPTAVNFLKIRASYGEVGNERVGVGRTGGSEFFNFYPYQGIFEPITNILFYQNNTVGPALGIRQDFLSDRDIRWERTRTIDVGLDVGLFDDRVTMSFEYYDRRTDDIIDLLDIPNYMGFPANTRTNVASIQAKGLDIELGYRNKIGDLNYSIFGNTTIVNTQVNQLGGAFFLSGGGTFINKPGFAYNEWFGFQTNGLFQTQEEANAYGTGAFAGDIWIVDQLTIDTNGDGILDSGDRIINEQDRIPLGSSLPRLTYGGSINLDYKGFDFSVVFNGVGLQNRRYDPMQVRPFQQSFGNVPLNLVDRFWSPNNSPEQNANAQFPRLSQRSFRNYDMSDYWLFNGAFLRVQNITFGYTIPTSTVERIKIQRARVYLGMRDFFTLQRNFLNGWDPEAGNTSYPIMKTFLLGLQVQL